jgi:hypothetical protein
LFLLEKKSKIYDYLLGDGFKSRIGMTGMIVARSNKNKQIKLFSKLSNFKFYPHYTIIMTRKTDYTKEELKEINYVIEKAEEHEYDQLMLETLLKYANHNHPCCLLHYGQYLLHMTPQIEQAFDFIYRSYQNGSREAKYLIQSVIESSALDLDYSDWENKSLKNLNEWKRQFCIHWSIVHKKDMIAFDE